MPKNQRNLEEHEGAENMKKERRLIARTTKLGLVLIIIFLLISILLIIFRVDEVFWPLWLVEHRTQAIGIGLLITIPIILCSPIIIEANSNPRTLKGPGRDPRFGDFWTKS
jgi:hypothetical protein